MNHDNLDPAAPPEMIGRPKNPNDTDCPIYKKPVNEVCHRCEFWKYLDIEVNGQPSRQWRCALTWPATLAAKTVLQLGSVEAEVHRTNDEFRDFRLGVGQMVDSMVAAQRILTQIEEQYPEKIRAEEIKVIENGTKDISSSPA